MSGSAVALRGVKISKMRKIHVGDIVRTGVNRYPCYRVVAISADRAWIRDVQYGADHVVPVSELREVR